MPDGFLPGSISAQTGTNRFKPATIPNPASLLTGVTSSELLPTSGGEHQGANLEFGTSPPRRTHDGSRPTSAVTPFFDEVYVLPVSIDAGIILSVQVHTIDIYSSYKTQARLWTAYDDASVGSGVTLSPPVPGASIQLPPQSGTTRSLTIGQQGPPSINGTLDFTFDAPGLVQVALTGQRSTLFPFPPTSPVTERLAFVTDIQTSASGKEHRASLRDVPRVEYDLTIPTSARARAYMNNLLFDGQARAQGLPIWHRNTFLSAPVAINDTMISVASTDYADYRVGGLAVVWTDPFTFETLQISAFDATSITFASPFTKAFTAGTYVMPVHTALITDRVRQRVFAGGHQEDRIRFTLLDNQRPIASAAGYSTYTPPITANNPNPVARFVLDDPSLRLQDVAITGDMVRTVQVVDGKVGTFTQLTDELGSRRGIAHGVATSSPASLHAFLQLMYEVRGRWKAFYLPSQRADFESAGNIGSADQAIDVNYCGFNDSIGPDRLGRMFVRIHKTDGTSSGILTITGTSEPSPGVERLSFAPATVGITATVAEVDRIELVEKMRLDTDRVVLRHQDNLGTMEAALPLRALLEEDDAP